MGSFCGFSSSVDRIGSDFESCMSKSCRVGWSSNLPTVAGSKTVFTAVVVNGWSFIDGCGDAFWEELVVFLCVVWAADAPSATARTLATSGSFRGDSSNLAQRAF